MANHGPSYGLDYELEQKRLAKFDVNLENQAKDWIEALTGKQVGDFHEDLKNGQILCELINVLSPGSVNKVNKNKMAFMMMENINNFLYAAKMYGVPDSDLFMTVDLYEAKNLGQVVDTIHALGRAAQRNGYNGPTIGAKLADRHEVDFTEEQLNAGKNILSLQTKGSHGNANASGMFDTSREIKKLG
eukprot:TRINITY_DN136634_c0_g1_i1.p1 TRINITY_DN136634_c0_g1~~TRINITY_DN136634_c0_g1_i1.p1  ORF type:complete len:195 (-),score=56.52 TRINITY_DN136634_c0_g1_i1:169-732(-)